MINGTRFRALIQLIFDNNQYGLSLAKWVPVMDVERDRKCDARENVMGSGISKGNIHFYAKIFTVNFSREDGRMEEL